MCENISLDSINATIDQVVKNQPSENIIGISYGAALDGGEYDYIRVTIHATNIFSDEVDLMEHALQSSFEELFPSIPILHIDSLPSTCDEVRRASDAILWAYKANCATE